MISSKQHLQIFTVKGASQEEMEGKDSPMDDMVPPAVKKYRMYNDVHVFVYSKPFRKGQQKNKGNEFEVRVLLFVCLS